MSYLAGGQGLQHAHPVAGDAGGRRRGLLRPSVSIEGVDDLVQASACGVVGDAQVGRQSLKVVAGAEQQPDKIKLIG